MVNGISPNFLTKQFDPNKPPAGNIVGIGTPGVTIPPQINIGAGDVGLKKAEVPAFPTTEIVSPDVLSKFQTIQTQLGTPQIDIPAAITPQVQEQLQAIPQVRGLPSEFFQRGKEQALQRLEQTFFGPLGRAQQTASQESAAGRLGSGVGQRVLEEAVTRPFIQEAAGIESQFLQAEQQERARAEAAQAQIEQFKVNVLSNALATDSSNKLKAQDALAQQQATLNNIASTLALGEQGLATQTDIANAKLQLETLIAIENQKSQTQKDLFDFSSLPVNPADWGVDFFSTLRDRGLTQEDAQLFAEMMSDAAPEFRETFFNAWNEVFGQGLQETLPGTQ